MTHPFYFTWTAQQDAMPVAISGGNGVYFETPDGKVLDLGSLSYQAALGHGNKRVVEAVKAQADRLCLSLPHAVYPEKIALAEALLAQAGPGYSKVFFCLGGAEANEHALRMARLLTGRYKVVSRYRSYHGATMGAATLTGDWRRAPVEPGLVGVVHVLDLDASLRGGPSTVLPRTLELEENVAAVFLEAVVGANGVLIPPTGYLEEVAAACKRHGALLVMDEVLTGFGRTGEWFGFQHSDVEPDLITLGKALTGGYGTLGAVLVHDRVAKSFDQQTLVSGLTHYAHPLGVAAALETVRVLKEEKMVDRARSLEEPLGTHVSKLADRCTQLGEVRVIGALAAIDAKLSAPQWKALKQALRRERVHMHANARADVLVFAPPLCIEEAELEEGVKRVEKALGSALEASS